MSGTSTEQPSTLTQLAGGGGCGCKIAASVLLRVLREVTMPGDPRVLVGPGTADDAAVVRISDDVTLVQTIDFFPPPVDDPYDFGRIAAANALSDVYAMGATPVTALNVVSVPLDELGPDVLKEILRGGADVCAEAGVAVVGGHSIQGREPLFGLSVTGLAPPDGPITNAGGRPGDALVLTKPLGVGAVILAHGKGLSTKAMLDAAVALMTTLNRDSADAARDADAHAMTDVTGFGLLGHLHHLARESGLSATVDACTVPEVEGVATLLEDDQAISGGNRRNAEWAATFTTIDEAVPRWRRRLLADPMTSGGLLVAVAPERALELPGTVVGRLVPGPAGAIAVR